MFKFNASNWKPGVSRKWPEEVGLEIIEKLMKIALSDNQRSKKGVITINGVSASVVDGGSGFLLIRTEELNDKEAWRIDVLFPVKTSIVKLEQGRLSHTEKVPVYDLPLKLTRDHQFSDWFKLGPDNHKLVMGVPVLEDIFKEKGITGQEVYNYALETTYRTHKGLLPRTVFIQIMPEHDPIARMKKVSDDQWEMTCYEALVPIRLSSCKQKVIIFVVITCLALASMIMFIIVHRMNA